MSGKWKPIRAKPKLKPKTPAKTFSFSGGGRVTQEQIKAYNDREKGKQQMYQIGKTAAKVVAEAKKPLIYPSFQGYGEVSQAQRDTFILKTKVEAYQLPGNIQIIKDLNASLYTDKHDAKYDTYKDPYDRTASESRDEQTLAAFYAIEANSAKAKHNVSTDSWNNFASNAHTLENQMRLNIRINPETGEVEMFVGENVNIFGQTGTNTSTQRFVNVQAAQISEELGAHPVIEKGRQLAFDGSANLPLLGETQLWGGYDPGNTDKTKYAEYLDALARDLGVDRIYAHGAGVSIVQIMNHPAERIGIDGLYDLNKNERVGEQREFLNFVSKQGQNTNDAITGLAAFGGPVVLVAKYDYGDEDLQRDLGKQVPWLNRHSEKIKNAKKTKQDYANEKAAWDAMSQAEKDRIYEMSRNDEFE